MIRNESANSNIGNRIRFGGCEDEVKDESMKVGLCMNMLSDSA